MIARIFGSFLIAVFLCTMCVPCFGQKKKKTTKPLQDTTIHQDLFQGSILRSADTVPTLLELDHKFKEDGGTFNLVENIKAPGGRVTPVTTSGKWLVRTEQVGGDDAPVVQLSGDGDDFVVFFLRKNDSTLQKISAQFDEIAPAALYTLRKVIPVGVKPVKDSITEHDKTMMRLSGTFRGTLPCGDCNSIVSTLSMRFRLHAKSGDFTLSDKYTGTRNGDITSERKGHWNYIARQIEADHMSYIIVLDADKRGHETYYLVRREGVVQLDNKMHRIEGPGDRMLRRQ